jgi:hypothetical protein
MSPRVSMPARSIRVCVEPHARRSAAAVLWALRAWLGAADDFGSSAWLAAAGEDDCCHQRRRGQLHASGWLQHSGQRAKHAVVSWVLECTWSCPSTVAPLLCNSRSLRWQRRKLRKDGSTCRAEVLHPAAQGAERPATSIARYDYAGGCPGKVSRTRPRKGLRLPTAIP